MSEVFIKYNPYKLETIIKIGGETIPENSELNVGEKRLQEWIEDLPLRLQEECNDVNFDITFQGTSMDFEDLEEIARNAANHGIYINLKHIPVKDIGHIELAIEEVFDEIIHGPIEELKTKDLKDAFKKALNDEFEITVVATMSAGKSTLINSLLRKKIMPSSQEACTATIARIRDTDEEEFIATGYDSLGNKVKFISDVQLNDMTKLNADESISTIELDGDIPFTSTDEMSLVLVDTPGPNNSRDENHLKTTFKNLDESSKALVLYILNATQLGVDDDSRLLDAVSSSMKVGGKQSKDRYLFVVNKIDTFRKGDDSVEQSLEKVRKYLADRDIHNPNLFPAAALPALDIRELMKNSGNIDEDLEDEIYMTARKLNRNEQLHLENYATLTASTKNKLLDHLEKVEDGDKENLETALIHTGIPSIEETIKQYVEKYARTAKIKNVVDTFQKKLESSRVFEQTKSSIAENAEKHKQIKEQIRVIEQKLNSGDEAKQFKGKIEDLDIMPEIEKQSKEVRRKHQNDFDEMMTDVAQKEYSYREAEIEINNLLNIANQLNAKFNANLEKVIDLQLIQTAQQLLEEYKNRITSLIDGIDSAELMFEPLQLISAEIDFTQDKQRILNDATETRRVKVGEKWVPNPKRKGFWGMFKFWEDKKIKRDIYENQEFVIGAEIADNMTFMVEEQMIIALKETKKYAKEQLKKIKFDYKRKFDQVDQILREKLIELNKFTEDADTIQELINESKQRLIWLENIEQKVVNITEIEEEILV